MNTAKPDKNRFLVFGAAVAIVMAIFLMGRMQSALGAQPGPDKPPFEGRLVEAPDGADTSAALTTVVEFGPEWRALFTENFDSANWENNWDANLDRSASALGYKWGTRAVGNTEDPTSVAVGWSIGGGANGGQMDPLAASYPAGVDSWLVSKAFDLSRAKDVALDLDFFYQADSGDEFIIAASENRLDFVPQYTKDATVNQGQWEPLTVPLSNFAGKKQVWIAIIFRSGSPANKLGAMVDNVRLMVEGDPGYYLPIVSAGKTATPKPQPTVTPTATPPPAGGDYQKGFGNNIDPWAARRWRLGTAYNVGHDGGSDDGRSGFLNVLVNTRDAYVIVSPLVAGPKPPYNIEIEAKLRSPRETGDQYGIIFGGNYAGGACPAPNFGTCFTQYYEMRVRFYDDNGTERMEMKLKRIDGHDSNNNNFGPDLIEWTRVRDVDESGFVEWDVTVESDGDIAVAANDRLVARARDNNYINNPYFGVIVRTEDKTNSEVKFDYYKID